MPKRTTSKIDSKYNFSEKDFNAALKKSGANLLYKKIPADTITPVLASLKLAQHLPSETKYSFLLESAQKGNNKGRFSVIGLMPDLIWKCNQKNSFISNNFTKKSANFVKENGDIISNLRRLIESSKINWNNLNYIAQKLPAICAGIFGYMSYDMVRLMENLPDKNLPDDLKIPDSIFIRPQILLIFDNLFDCVLICAPNFQKQKFLQLTKKISLIEEALKKPYQALPVKKPASFNFSSNFSQKEYCHAVEKAKKYITDGDIFQVLPSQRFSADFDAKISEFSFYRALRSINPSPFLFYLKFPDFCLIGSSPEIMVSLKDKKVTLRPLAGTRKRGNNAIEDQKIAAELLNDEKEIAEHLMLIDLGRHDVGKVAKAGSVAVTEKMIIENYSHVMHISSNVEGIIRDDLDALDVLISGFPAGTVSGAPKIRAMEIIEEIEKVKRSFYAGCVGYFASNGDMETCITLRSALIKDKKIHIQAGAGVVFDSDPKSEYQECVNKALGLIEACKKITDFI
ncbi:MAG: anthranilate synthase component I [Rickettsiales bacterium]|nr:anthranilate synthase component I [Rickettsiales bacterium]